MYYDKFAGNISDQINTQDSYGKQTFDTLVFHPDDPTTDFLSAIYEGKGWDVVNDPFVASEDVTQLIKARERIICLGHGSQDGLFGGYGMIINSNLAPMLRTKELVCIWCNADLFMKEHGLQGFFTGMFLSENDECDLFGVPHEDELQVEFSNDLFASVLGRHIDSGEDILGRVKQEYHDESDPVITFNRDRLFCNIGEK